MGLEHRDLGLKEKKEPQLEENEKSEMKRKIGRREEKEKKTLRDTAPDEK
jgi:hypothetical protein